jgi:predicted ATPase
VQQGSQFIVTTHSPILMAYPDACIYECEPSGIVEKAYEDLAHARVMRNFLADPAAQVRALLQPKA